MKPPVAPQGEAPGFDGWLRSVDRYWFGFGSPTSMALIRILIGSIATLNMLMLLPDWNAWFSERGFIPAWLGERALGGDLGIGSVNFPRMDVLRSVTDARLAFAIYLLILVAAVFTAIGLWSRVSSVALAIGTVSLDHRNLMILHGGDTMLRICAIYVALAPSGCACSVDRLIRLWKGAEVPCKPLEPVWSQRAMAYNVALIYFTTIWLKTRGSDWLNGTAVWYTFRLSEFYRFWVPHFLKDPPFVQFLTYGTLAVEFSLATLVFFKPFRKYAVAGGLMLHAGIDYTMNIPLFAPLMMSSYLAFYDGDEIDAWAKRFGTRFERFAVTLVKPRGTTLTQSAHAVLAAVDPFGLVRLVDGTGESWEARNSNGRSGEPGRIASTRCIGLWPALIFAPSFVRKLLKGGLIPLETDGGEARPKRKKEGTRKRSRNA